MLFVSNDIVFICFVVFLHIMRVSETDHIESLLIKGIYKHLSYKI